MHATTPSLRGVSWDPLHNKCSYPPVISSAPSLGSSFLCFIVCLSVLLRQGFSEPRWTANCLSEDTLKLLIPCPKWQCDRHYHQIPWDLTQGFPYARKHSAHRATAHYKAQRKVRRGRQLCCEDCQESRLGGQWGRGQGMGADGWLGQELSLVQELRVGSRDGTLFFKIMCVCPRTRACTHDTYVCICVCRCSRMDHCLHVDISRHPQSLILAFHFV